MFHANTMLQDKNRKRIGTSRNTLIKNVILGEIGKECRSRRNFRIISIADSTLSRSSPGTFRTIEKSKVKTFGCFSGFSRNNLKIFRHKDKPAFSFPVQYIKVRNFVQ